MPKTIAVIGAGPGLGRAVARRYAREGYEVVLVARDADRLESLRDELAATGAAVHVVAADLSEQGAGARLAASLRAEVGVPDVVYYGPGMRGYVPIADLTGDQLSATMAMAVYSLVDLVHDLLPDMIARRDGAFLAAAGMSAVVGMPQLSGTAGLAAQRNVLQALEAAVTDDNVFVGRLYIGATIKDSAFHTQQEAARSRGEQVIDLPVVEPDHLADLLWEMQATRDRHETTYPPREHAGS